MSTETNTDVDPDAPVPIWSNTTTAMMGAQCAVDENARVSRTAFETHMCGDLECTAEEASAAFAEVVNKAEEEDKEDDKETTSAEAAFAYAMRRYRDRPGIRLFVSWLMENCGLAPWASATDAENRREQALNVLIEPRGARVGIAIPWVYGWLARTDEWEKTHPERSVWTTLAREATAAEEADNGAAGGSTRGGGARNTLDRLLRECSPGTLARLWRATGEVCDARMLRAMAWYRLPLNEYCPALKKTALEAMCDARCPKLFDSALRMRLLSDTCFVPTLFPLLARAARTDSDLIFDHVLEAAERGLENEERRFKGEKQSDERKPKRATWAGVSEALKECVAMDKRALENAVEEARERFAMRLAVRTARIADSLLDVDSQINTTVTTFTIDEEKEQEDEEKEEEGGASGGEDDDDDDTDDDENEEENEGEEDDEEENEPQTEGDAIHTAMEKGWRSTRALLRSRVFLRHAIADDFRDAFALFPEDEWLFRMNEDGTVLGDGMATFLLRHMLTAWQRCGGDIEVGPFNNTNTVVVTAEKEENEEKEEKEEKVDSELVERLETLALHAQSTAEEEDNEEEEDL